MDPRKSKYVIVAEISYALCRREFPPYAHPKSPHHFTLPQLGACVLLMHYMRLSYRDMEEWLLARGAVCAALELAAVPDPTTLYRLAQRLDVGRLEALNQRLLRELGLAPETGVAVDTTGFSATAASLHYLARSGQRFRHFPKGAFAIGLASRCSLGVVSGQGPGADSVHLGTLRAKAARWAEPAGWVLLGDAGFAGRYARPGDLIPPIRRGGGLAQPHRVARAELVAAARLDGYYGQRWQVETVISVIKRKFGATLRAHKRRHRQREIYRKALIYNIHR